MNLLSMKIDYLLDVSILLVSGNGLVSFSGCHNFNYAENFQG